MERHAWERALARAVTDQRFQARLLADPATTLVDYGLGAEDRPYVAELGGLATLPELAAKLLHLAATVWAPLEKPSVAPLGDDLVLWPFLTPMSDTDAVGAGGSAEPRSHRREAGSSAAVRRWLAEAQPVVTSPWRSPSSQGVCSLDGGQQDVNHTSTSIEEAGFHPHARDQ